MPPQAVSLEHTFIDEDGAAHLQTKNEDGTYGWLDLGPAPPPATSFEHDHLLQRVLIDTDMDSYTYYNIVRPLLMVDSTRRRWLRISTAPAGGRFALLLKEDMNRVEFGCPTKTCERGKCQCQVEVLPWDSEKGKFVQASTDAHT